MLLEEKKKKEDDLLAIPDLPEDISVVYKDKSPGMVGNITPLSSPSPWKKGKAHLETPKP